MPRIVVECDAVEPKIDAALPLGRGAIEMPALNVIEGGRAKRQRRVRGITAAANDVDVGRVVDAGGRRDGAVVEDAFLKCEHLAGAGRHEHDVHKLRFNNLLDDVAKLVQAAIFTSPG